MSAIHHVEADAEDWDLEGVSHCSLCCGIVGVRLVGDDDQPTYTPHWSVQLPDDLDRFCEDCWEWLRLLAPIVAGAE